MAGSLLDLEPGAQKFATSEGCVRLSIAISLKRIADRLDAIDAPNEQGDSFSQRIYYAISNSIQDAIGHWARSR